MDKIFNKISNFFKSVFDRTIERSKEGIDWIGTDGLLNMESSALLTIFLMIFFSPIISVLISLGLVFTKCLIDNKNGHAGEKHDFICAVVGVVAGVILGATTMSIVLF